MFGWTKTYFYVRLTDKEWAINWEEYSQKDDRPYFSVLVEINNYSSTLVYTVLLTNTSEITFCVHSNLIQNRNFIYIRLSDTEWWSSWEECNQSYGRPYFIVVNSFRGMALWREPPKGAFIGIYCIKPAIMGEPVDVDSPSVNYALVW